MKQLLLSIIRCIGCLSIFLVIVPVAMGAEFHVFNGTTFQDALDTAADNGEGDTIYLTVGVYDDCYYYLPEETEHQDLTITGEPGTRPEDVILDGSKWEWSPPLLIIDYHYDEEYGPEAGLTINGLTIRNGQSEGGAYSGGMDIRMYAYNVTITNCIIQNNSGKHVGGGFRIETLYGVLVENNIIIDNTLNELGVSPRWVYGGGVFINGVFFGDIVLRNNVIAGNTVNGGTEENMAGGVWIGGYACSAGPSVYLINNTIYNNTCREAGGGVYFYASRNLYTYNNIIYGNTAAGGGDIYINVIPDDRVSQANNYSDFGGDAWSDEWGRINTDPLFVNPSLNDYHLQPGSLMIDWGTTTVHDPPGLPTVDLDGAPRLTGSSPDAGAYEFRAVPRPRIRLNGSDGMIELVTYTDTLRFDLSLDNAGLSNDSDWWLMMISPYGFHYATLSGWTTTQEPWFQMPLSYVAEFSTYDIPIMGWLPGYYFFFFAVDTVMDGAYTPGSAYYDYIVMRILE
ncbi:MAG: right-handed parallel beta-helix repeat-containing protein [Deltaproteobacteria bacterium]|nr:right-handed parallel beta-helix repeat-containing protein [Deltaproteobacteria bacterium]